MTTAPIGTKGVATIFQDLQSIRINALSGIYYVVSQDNHQGRLVFQAGHLIAAFFHAHRDAKALDCLANSYLCKFKFQRDPPSPQQDAALYLENTPLDQELSRRLQEAAPQGTAPAPPPAAYRTLEQLSAEEEKAIRRVLIERLGPIGNFLYDDYRTPHAAIKNVLLKIATENFSDPAEGMEFLNTVQKHVAI